MSCQRKDAKLTKFLESRPQNLLNLIYQQQPRSDDFRFKLLGPPPAPRVASVKELYFMHYGMCGLFLFCKIHFSVFPGI